MCPAVLLGLKYFTDSWLFFSFKNQNNEVVHKTHSLVCIYWDVSKWERLQGWSTWE